MAILPASRIDHRAVTAPALESGVAWIEQLLGVPMEAGGEHPLMGTHDRLLRLGDDICLEVITVNPQAATPGQRRWRGLPARRACTLAGKHGSEARRLPVAATRGVGAGFRRLSGEVLVLSNATP